MASRCRDSGHGAPYVVDVATDRADRRRGAVQATEVTQPIIRFVREECVVHVASPRRHRSTARQEHPPVAIAHDGHEEGRHAVDVGYDVVLLVVDSHEGTALVIGGEDRRGGCVGNVAGMEGLGICVHGHRGISSLVLSPYPTENRPCEDPVSRSSGEGGRGWVRRPSFAVRLSSSSGISAASLPCCHEAMTAAITIPNPVSGGAGGTSTAMTTGTDPLRRWRIGSHCTETVR